MKVLLNNEANYSCSVWGQYDLMKNCFWKQIYSLSSIDCWHISKQITGIDEYHKLEKNISPQLKSLHFMDMLWWLLAQCLYVQLQGPEDSSAITGYSDDCQSVTVNRWHQPPGGDNLHGFTTGILLITWDPLLTSFNTPERVTYVETLLH